MEIVNSQTFDFTDFVDSDEDPFEILIESLKAMRVEQNEIPESIFNENQNSPHGIFGMYRTGNGKPDVVIADEESPIGSAGYRYWVKVYLLNPEEENAWEDVITIIKTLMEEIEQTQFLGKF